jgi:hypothetical protein
MHLDVLQRPGATGDGAGALQARLAFEHDGLCAARLRTELIYARPVDPFAALGAMPPRLSHWKIQTTHLHASQRYRRSSLFNSEL